MKRKTRKARKILTAEQKAAKKAEQAKKRKEFAFRKTIRSTFTLMGFTYFPTLNKTFHIGHQDAELDYIFLWENLLLICEDTCGAEKNIEHIRKKDAVSRVIKENLAILVDWLCETFPDKKDLLKKYRLDRLLVYYIYIPKFEWVFSQEDKARFNNLIFWEPQTLSYFYRMAQTIQYSARYEIFRFLNLRDDQLGYSTSAGDRTTIKAPIIYPEDTTGLNNGIRVISFMMSAEKLLQTSYVLRKDNWEESMFLYQRLLEKEKIRDIREFLVNKGEAFFNNIIVSLPDSVKFEIDSGNIVSIDKVQDFQNCKLLIPNEMNSVCIIDGQHRIYAHHEAPANDKYEAKIATLRKQLHLLVTGLVFPPDMPESKRRQIESEIFLDINNNAKKVSQSVLTHIEMIKDPFSDIGLARRTIERLNEKHTLFHRFELSGLEDNKIKVASIIQFALRYLVTLEPTSGRMSLFTCWNGNKEGVKSKNTEELALYLDFCATTLDMYFSAVKSVFKDAWSDPASKLLSVTSINGFIIALNRQLPRYGLQDFSFYRDHLQNLRIDFSKANFPYTSSQYRKFSTQILLEAFDFDQDDTQKY